METEVHSSSVIDQISKRLSEFFVLTNVPYEGSTDFNREHKLLKAFSKNPNKMTIMIHKAIVDEMKKKFGLFPKKIGQSKLEVDLWDSKRNIAYEIILGDGEEIWKDILKAILVKAEKLVVFCRNYPDVAIRGHREIKNIVANLEIFLKERLQIQIVLIEVTHN
jgi:hypothetical protein